MARGHLSPCVQESLASSVAHSLLLGRPHLLPLQAGLGRGYLRSERSRVCRVQPGPPTAKAGGSCLLLPEWPTPQVDTWVRAKSSRRPTYTPLPLGSSVSAPALPSACSTRSRTALWKLAGRTGSLRALSARRNLSLAPAQRRGMQSRSPAAEWVFRKDIPAAELRMGAPPGAEGPDGGWARVPHTGGVTGLEQAA